jgi:uncharacterized protein YjbI with pentapeptide repeats
MQSTLRRANLTNADLFGAFARWIQAEGVNFARAKLGNVFLDKGVIRQCNFAGADLAGVSFEGSQIVDVSFDNLDLTNGYLLNMSLTNVTWVGAKLSNANLKGTTGFDGTGAIFKNNTMPDGTVRTDP